MNKGVFVAVALDEFTIESKPDRSGQSKPKAKLRISFPGKFVAGQNGQQGKSEYCHCNCYSSQQFLIDQIMALGLQQGQMPRGQGVPKIHLTIPYKNIIWSIYNGQHGPGVNAYCDIDGDVSFATPPPRKQNGNGYGGNAGAPPFQNQGGYPPQGQQPSYPPQSGYPPQGQNPAYPPNQGGYPPPAAPQFPAQQPPGFAPQGQNPAYPPQNPGYPPPQQPAYPPQGQQPGYPPQQPAAPAYPPTAASPFPAGQPNFGNGPAPSNFAGPDPYTA